MLVSCTGDCLLCDFGLSRIRHEISRTYTTIHQGGRQRFIAPEISSGLEARINEKSDVYSLAMTIYALGTMSLPFGHIERDLAVYRAVQEGERPQPCDSLGGLAAEETAHLWSVMERMWKQDPDCRPTVSSARDEMMQTSQICLELTTTSIATSSTSVQPPALITSLDIANEYRRQLYDVDSPINNVRPMPGYVSCRCAPDCCNKLYRESLLGPLRRGRSLQTVSVSYLHCMSGVA